MLPLLVLGSTVAGHAQSIAGVVRSEQDNALLPGAEVALLGVDGERIRAVNTDSTGAFRLDAPRAGVYQVQVDRIGYRQAVSEPIELGPVEQIQVTIYLSIDAVELDPLIVTERRRYPNQQIQSLYERADLARSTGRGRVYTRDDLERIRPHRLSHLLFGPRATCRGPTRYYLDGMNMGIGAEALELLESMVVMTNIEGVEIYRGYSQMPTEYVRSDDCGAILVWSKAVDKPRGAAPVGGVVLLSALVLLLIF